MIQAAGVISVLLLRAIRSAWREHLSGGSKLQLGVIPPGARVDELASGSMLLSVDEGVERRLNLETGAIDTVPAEVMPSAMMAFVCAALDENDMHYVPLTLTTVALFYKEDHGHYVIIYSVDDADRKIHVWTVFGATVPESSRAAVRELLERINSRIAFAQFELDDKAGDVYVRLRISPSETELTPALARQAVGSVLGEAEDYHEIIMRVAYGGTTVEQAIVEKELW